MNLNIENKTMENKMKSFLIMVAFLAFVQNASAEYKKILECRDPSGQTQLVVDVDTNNASVGQVVVRGPSVHYIATTFVGDKFTGPRNEQQVSGYFRHLGEIIIPIIPRVENGRIVSSRNLIEDVITGSLNISVNSINEENFDFKYENGVAFFDSTRSDKEYFEFPFCSVLLE